MFVKMAERNIRKKEDTVGEEVAACHCPFLGGLTAFFFLVIIRMSGLLLDYSNKGIRYKYTLKIQYEGIA